MICDGERVTGPVRFLIEQGIRYVEFETGKLGEFALYHDTKYTQDFISTAIYGELMISSTDQDVTNEGTWGTVFFMDRTDLGATPGEVPGTSFIWIKEPGRYTIEMAPGYEVATETTIIFGTTNEGDFDITLRDVRVELEKGLTDPILTFRNDATTPERRCRSV